METIKNESDELEKSSTLETGTAREKSNIILFLSSKTISLLGSSIYNFALSLYILKVTGSGASFTINVLLGMLPRIILGPIAGIIADRVDRRKATIILDTLSGITVFGLLMIGSSSGLKVGFIYITSLILSVINVFYDTMLSSSIPNLVTDKKLMKINAYASASSSLSGILGPILGGIIYSFAPINLFLIANAISFIVSALLEFFMDFNFNKAALPQHKEGRSFMYDLREIIAFIKKQKTLFSLFKFSLLLNLFANAAFSITYPFVINNVLKMSPNQFGTIEASFSIGLLAASIVIGSIKEIQRKLPSICLALAATGLIIIMTGLPTLGLSFFSNKAFLFIFYIVLMLLTGVLLVIINTPLMVVMQRLTPDNLMGRFMGILGTLTGGIAPIGIVITGLIIDKVPSFSILSVTGTAIIVMSIIMINSKSLKEL